MLGTILEYISEHSKAPTLMEFTFHLERQAMNM